jgi:hypothetical protein
MPSYKKRTSRKGSRKAVKKGSRKGKKSYRKKSRVPKFQIKSKSISDILDRTKPFGMRHSSRHYSDIISDYTKPIEMPLYYWRQWNEQVWNGEILTTENILNPEDTQGQDEYFSQEFPPQSINVYVRDEYAPQNVQTLYWLETVPRPNQDLDIVLGHYLIIANNRNDANRYLINRIDDHEFTIDLVHSWKVVHPFPLINGVHNLLQDA